MRCADCRDAVNAFVDGELLADEQRDVREHLATCADCRREHEVFVTTSRTLKEEVAFDDSNVTSVDWRGYPILTYPEVPQVNVTLINRLDQPATGAGEQWRRGWR